MTSKYLAVGDSLGVLNVQGQLKYRIKTNGVYELTDELFFIWESVRSKSHILHEQLKNLEQSDRNNFEELLLQLVEAGLIVKLENNIEQILNNYALFPKGNVVKQTNLNYDVVVLRKHDAIQLPILPYLIWEHAHPFVPIKEVVEIVRQQSKVENENILKVLEEWLPLYISTGLASLKQVD